MNIECNTCRRLFPDGAKSNANAEELKCLFVAEGGSVNFSARLGFSTESRSRDRNASTPHFSSALEQSFRSRFQIESSCLCLCIR